MNAQSDDLRKWHYLRRNHSTKVPNRILCFDTETLSNPVDGKPKSTLETLRVWSATSCRIGPNGPHAIRTHFGSDRSSFIKLLSSLATNRQSLWCFAHNIGFDLTVLRIWELLESGTLCFSHNAIPAEVLGTRNAAPRWRGMAVINDPPTILKMRISGTTKTLTFVDTYNYFRCPLRALGEMVGLAKLEMPKANAEQIEWIAYCARDTAIVHHAITGLIQFVRENDLGTFAYTAPGQAMAAYKHRFMDERILIHGNKDAVQLEREAYFGGRNQCLRIGKVIKEPTDLTGYLRESVSPYPAVSIGPVHVLDIQSCYPSVMRSCQFPTKIVAYEVSPTIKQLKEQITGKNLVIARVRLNAVTNFPIRKNSRTFMARGRFVATLCGPELYRACEESAITSVGAMATYEPGYIFRNYVDYFYGLRNKYKSESNPVYANMCKVMLNSLFGKFGQRANSWEDRPQMVAPEPWGSWCELNGVTRVAENYRSLAWMVQKEYRGGEGFNSFPAIAAYVTSYARELIQHYLTIAGENNCWYIDTDSLHVNEQGYENLCKNGCIEPYRLGYLKLVGMYDTAEYRGLKDYTVGDVDIIAGLKHKHTKLQDGSREQLNFQRLRSILAGPPPAGVRVDRVRVTLGEHVPPGELLPDGRLLTPVLDE